MSHEEKDKALNDVISKKYPNFKNWHERVWQVVSNQKFYYNEELKQFTQPFLYKIQDLKRK
jgi:hypothetical protein